MATKESQLSIKINQAPYFKSSVGEILIQVDSEAIKVGSDDGKFEFNLPEIIDDENDIPILEMSDPSG